MSGSSSHRKGNRADWLIGRLRIIRYPLYNDKMIGHILYLDRSRVYRPSLEIMLGNRVYVFEMLER